MKVEDQIVHFDNEKRLQDALNANGLGAQTYHDNLLKMLDDGKRITVEVPGMPTRLIVRKSSIEGIANIPDSEPNLVAIALP